MPENALRSFRNAPDAATNPANKNESIQSGPLNRRLLPLVAAGAFVLLMAIAGIWSLSRDRSATITQSDEMSHPPSCQRRRQTGGPAFYGVSRQLLSPGSHRRQEGDGRANAVGKSVDGRIG